MLSLPSWLMLALGVLIGSVTAAHATPPTKEGGLWFAVVLWLMGLTVLVVVLTGITIALHLRQRQLLPPVSRSAQTADLEMDLTSETH